MADDKAAPAPAAAAKTAFDKAELKKDVSWLGARMREPSSYIGIVAFVLASFHVANAASLQELIVGILVGIGGVIGFVLPEGGKK